MQFMSNYFIDTEMNYAKPALCIADLISILVFSVTGINGSLTSSEHNPKRAIAYLTPTSPGSVKIA